MTSQILLGGTLLALIAGVCNGAFFLPARYARKWQWENTWLIFSIVSQLVLPWVAAALAVPNLVSIFRQSPFSYFVPGLVGGLVWGVGQVLYGLGLSMVGIAIGNAIVAAMAVTAGTVGPMLVYAPEKVFTPRALVLLVAIALIVAGIYLYGKAALRKEREVAGLAEGVPQASSNFRRGLIICLFTGILGTAFIYSLVSSHGLLQAAQAAGAKPLFAGYVAWVVTFNAGFLPNLLYSLYLLRKNRSTRAFGQSEVLARNSSLGALMGLIWFSGVLMYGMGVTQMGRLGPSVGYGLFVSSTVLSANFLGWLSGEWKGASPATVRGFMKGMVLIVIAVFVIAVGVS